MQNKRFIVKYLLLSTALLWMCVTVSAQDLVILHTNDVHSNIEPLRSGRNEGLGGFQRMANYIQTVRQNHPNVLLLDAGDYNQGTPYYTVFQGKMEIMLYNAMGYDAVVLGNHEFDDGQQALAVRLKEAQFVSLCANYNFKGTPLDGLVEPYTIVEKGGRKIGIIGVLLDLRGYVSESSREGLKYKNPIPVVNRYARRLKKREGCDLVIVLSHLGYTGGSKERPTDTEVAKYTRNVDLIIGGHSHTFLEKPTVVKNSAGEDVIINQTGATGVYMGRIDINF